MAVAVEERAALLALLTARPRQWAAVAQEVEERGSALAVLEGGPAGPQQQLFHEETADPAAREKARRAIEAWEREGIHFASLLDPEYPMQLLTIHQRPPFVTWRGRLDAIDAAGVAVVGSRSASDEGIARARRMAVGLATNGVTVISGLAKGIDTAAHIGALSAGGRTVAVIGTGLRRAYPAENTDLQRRIGEEGLVLSQFLPEAPPTKQSFPMRNAVMSGYGSATVVIEANHKSGARMQARLALEHGRAVFLLRSLLEHDWAREYAERPGARVVDSVDDVLGALDAIKRSGDEQLVWA
jgi:DNA processing protein